MPLTFPAKNWSKCLSALMLWSVTTALAMAPAQALVKVGDTESINMAIKYGIKKKDLGFSGILGPNWIEGSDGTLVNVYTPFMMLATQASKKGIDVADTAGIKEAKKRMARIIGQIQDEHEPQEIKFSAAIYGDKANIGSTYQAIIEGEGRGRSATVKPRRVFLDKTANQNDAATVFEAVNAYYFKFSDLENFETIRFILKSPQDEKSFTININDIY